MPLGVRVPALLILPLLVWGCPRPRPPVALLPVVSMAEAIQLINENSGSIEAGLQALGSARGHFTDDDGVKRAFNCDANLLVIPPRHLRLDMQTLGQTQVLFGSNEELYWLYVKPEIDTYWWGRYSEASPSDLEGVPVRPDMIMEAVGISGLGCDTTGSDGPFQRIDGVHQQLLFVTYDQDGQGLVSKEYWLARREPRLIEQILFRDALGQVVMRSRLGDYKRLGGKGPWIAHKIDADWPAKDAELHLKVRRWQMNPKLTPKLRAFIAPHDRGKTFKKMIDIDYQP